MDYFELNHVKAKVKFKEAIEEVLNELNNVVDGVMFVKARPGQDGHAEVWIDERTSKCLACVDIREIIKFEDLYLFFHESGHVINKHFSDPFTRITIQQDEIINREKEADIYALKKMEELLLKLIGKRRDHKKVEEIIEVTKYRLDSGYEDYLIKKK
ncbi:hypothetical protein Desdi_3338 [Desulfitobacterium dichloroeliminans LMG P-21439]|uniref:Uncharacterized protein n=1 Tax=Desulfitobacterium dichloroeliminans (strain LMG P-21439 / DCA1) TaxID=871963 RepID=L0FBY5_DESDL|nr:hypothetical protein [Desulfitobacterium dichloroeliminans]AGA70732.1 hypothetical protein Desdi_3338 [Desulfitobacterium dichloroeliminans LMG P-21439]